MSQIWEAGWDPDEQKDYMVDWTEELDADSDTIDTVYFTLPAEALDADIVAYNLGMDVTQKKALLWIKSNDPAATRAALIGQTIQIDHRILTTDGRIFNITCELNIIEK